MKLAFLCILVLLVSCTAVYAVEIIDADNPNIQYTGRVYFGDVKAPVFYWPGCFLIANFQGTSIKIKYGDTGNNYMAVIIDDGPYTVLDCVAGFNTYTAATGLADTNHKIQLFKRTETQQGIFSFRGFELDDGKTLLPPPPRPEKRIEFYGDSITAGMALDSTADDQTPPYINNYLTYGALTARYLNADYHCIAVSGIGIHTSWFAGNMPDDYYDRHTGSATWDFSQWIPHIVVINLGQNDYAKGVTQIQAEQSYVDFARTLRGHYPDAHIIFALGSMSAVADGSPWPQYVQNAVDVLNVTYGDLKVYSCIFPYQGFYSHPHAPQHEDMAAQLTAFILDNIPNDLNNDRNVNYLDFGMVGLNWLADNRYVCEPNEAAWWKFDEGIGTTACDSSVYGRHGTLSDPPPTWTTNDFNGVLSFNGLDNYIVVNGYKGITGVRPRTVTAWINADAATDGVIVNWGQSLGVNGGKWRFLLDNGTGALRVSVTGGYVIATTDLRAAGWRHVAVVFASDGSPNVGDVRFYVDGVLDPIASFSGIAVSTTDDQDVSIGASLDGSVPGKYFRGLIDDVRIYDFALTDEMIQQVYNDLPPAGLACVGDYSPADLNRDCTVDINDLRIIAQDWLWPNQ